MMSYNSKVLIVLPISLLVLAPTVQAASINVGGGTSAENGVAAGNIVADSSGVVSSDISGTSF